MNEYSSFLVYVGCRGKGNCLKVAVKVHKQYVPEFYAEQPDAWMRRFLPEHIKSAGDIVCIEEIFDVVINIPEKEIEVQNNGK